jgi:hypothetical protein
VLLFSFLLSQFWKCSSDLALIRRGNGILRSHFVVCVFFYVRTIDPSDAGVEKAAF